MKQQQALDIMKAGQSCFLTGEAGAGKSYVLNQFIQYLEKNKVPYAATASTGIAAAQIGGQTIHSWAGIGIKDKFTKEDYLSLRNRYLVTERIQDCKVLIIDEISMLHRKPFELLDEVLRVIRGNEQPFGGVQLILCGDFFQLPPVGGDKEEKYADKFCFMSQSWVNAKLNVCYLTDQFRNKDGALNEILNAIRADTVEDKHFEILKETASNPTQKDTMKLFTHNANVDQINNLKLQKLEGEIKVFKANCKGPEKIIKNLKESVRCPEILELKLNAKVMFVKNSDDYMNGTQGVVTGFAVCDQTGDTVPEVTTTDGLKIKAEPATWEVMENDKVIASYEQIPLRLAWAITIHKSQGMTLSEAEIDLNRTFTPGQGYVALSRLRNINGLTLIGINPNALTLNKLARKADVRFQELSCDNEQIWNKPETEMTKLHNDALKWYKT